MQSQQQILGQQRNHRRHRDLDQHAEECRGHKLARVLERWPTCATGHAEFYTVRRQYFSILVPEFLRTLPARGYLDAQQHFLRNEHFFKYNSRRDAAVLQAYTGLEKYVFTIAYGDNTRGGRVSVCAIRGSIEAHCDLSEHRTDVDRRQSGVQPHINSDPDFLPHERQGQGVGAEQLERAAVDFAGSNDCRIY